MAGRGFSGSYRFGYQGSEKDNEVSGDGNSYTTEFRQLDPRLGRWFSVDPVFQPWQSPYTSMDSDPIGLNDPLGLDPDPENEGPMNDGGYTQGGDIGVIDDTSPLDGATHEDVENGNEVNTPSNQTNSQQNTNTSNYYEALARQQDAFSENANIFLANNSNSSNPDPIEWAKHIWNSITRGEKYLKKKIPRDHFAWSRQKTFYRMVKKETRTWIDLPAGTTTLIAESESITVGNLTVDGSTSGTTLNTWLAGEMAKPEFQSVVIELRLMGAGDSDAMAKTTDITISVTSTVDGTVYTITSLDNGDNIRNVTTQNFGTSTMVTSGASTNQLNLTDFININVLKTDTFVPPAGVPNVGNRVDACLYFRVEVRAFVNYQK